MPYKILLLATTITMSIWNTTLAAEVTEVTFDALPDTVKATVLNYVAKQRISKISKISDDSQARFEIEADKTENNKEVVAFNIVIANNGKIMKLSHEVPYYALSYPQMQAIEKRYPGISVSETESVETHYFDVVGKVNDQPVKFRLQEDNQIEELSPPQ